MYQGAPQTLAPPAAPTSLTAWTGDTQISLNWSAAIGAASYNVRRATTSAGPYSLVATGVTGTSFTDTGVTNSPIFYYIVTATNSSGTGLPSPEAAASAGAWRPVVHLRFDETGGTTAVDSTGNGWNGTLAGAASFVAGKSNNAVNLPGGTPDRVTLPSGVVSALNDFTISAWVKPSVVGTWSRVFDFGTDTTNYLFLTPRASTTGAVRFAIRTPAIPEQIIDGIAPLTADEWAHVAVTLSGTTGTFYVNGAAVGTNMTMTLRPSSLGSTTQNYIGDSQFSADPSLNGLVDEFQIYNRALTASEILVATQGNYTTWQHEFFTPAQIANTTISGPGADANGDGLRNILAYAFAVSPWNNLADSLPLPQMSGGYLTATFRRRLPPTDVTYGVEVSGALATWSSATTETNVTPIDAESELVTIRDNIPTSGQSRRFIRVRVTK